jgi:hypothetical protein
MLAGSRWLAGSRLSAPSAPLSAIIMVRCQCFSLGRGGKACGDSDGADAAGAPGAAPAAAPAPAPGPSSLAADSDTLNPPKLPRTELPLLQPAALANRHRASSGGGGKKGKAAAAAAAAAAPPLRVLTFNILADGLAQHGDFVNVSSVTFL